MLYDATHFDKPAEKKTRQLWIFLSGAFVSSNRVFGPVDCKNFFPKHTSSEMKSSNFSNSLNVRKLRFQKRFIIAAPVFLLACWKATATHEFQPSLWCPAIRGRCSNGRAAGAKAQDLTFVKRCYLKKKQIVFQGRFFQVFIC